MNLPSTLTVENLLEIKWLAANCQNVGRDSGKLHESAVGLLDQWIAELSPMEEPKEFGAMVEATYSGYSPMLFITNGAGWYRENDLHNVYKWPELHNPTPYKKEGA